MTKRIAMACAVTVLLGCGGGAAQPSADGGTEPDAAASTVRPPAECEGCTPREAWGPLEVRFLGVGGFLVEHEGEAVLTAPLFTRPNAVAVTLGTVASDRALVAQGVGDVSKVRAVLSGHAHYDHLLDVPEVLSRAPQATLYANVSARNLLASFSTTRPSRCTGVPQGAPTIARSRVVAMDDPAASVVDYRMCPDKRPEGAPLVGAWVRVPGAHVRVMAFCSEHPDQVGPVHFGPGSVDEEPCAPPPRADEGRTQSFLVDFLDRHTDEVRYRVYYQDAPTGSGVGNVPAPILAEKRIDMALLCVGTYDRVEGAPSSTLAALAPRFALGGHWEDFLRPASDPVQPIPLLDVERWRTRAEAALPPSAEPHPMWRGGQPATQRAVLPSPGDAFAVVP